MTVNVPDNRSSGIDVQPERPQFLGTHRAEAACARQFASLCDDMVQGATTMCATTEKDAPVVRQSPDRCILQLGPVAITVTWLRRNLGSVEDGELLIILWRGSVAPREDYLPERASLNRPPRSVTPLWEQTLRPVAASEANWVWQPRGSDSGGYTSSELAVVCVERVQRAHETCGAAEVEAASSSKDTATPTVGRSASARRASRVA